MGGGGWLENVILMKTQSSTSTWTSDLGLRLRVCQKSSERGRKVNRVERGLSDICDQDNKLSTGEDAELDEDLLQEEWAIYR